ncbi:sugar isomerase domain-containing protein [Ktedonosporobacter rubrisoli]|uniref:sugar isomerase domain-containing protein n=1 Tax=Ktedonosporobacter rubrisoli TaxID=2509675 RepID=UPI001A910B73|nr:sugar isomerase domain-containing protein [Ktedonosporobacter rubrisoli]
MEPITYLTEAIRVLQHIQENNAVIRTVADKAAETIARGNWVRLFGSGHSVLPTQDCFPRYGGYVGFYPIMDPRLMWTTVSGPGGAEELLWLERQENYINVFLRHNTWDANDMLIVVSHGGQNPAPVEMALAGKEAGLFVVAITSEDNHRNKPATHSSGKKIGDIADITIFNGVSSEDAVVSVPGVAGKVGGVSTLASIAIIQSIVSETALGLAQRGYKVKPFAAPNVEGLGPRHNEEVYEEFRSRLNRS